MSKGKTRKGTSTEPRRLGPLLRRIREDAGISLKSAGPDLDVDYTYLSKIENGRVLPSADLLQRLAEYFGVDPDTLFGAANRLPPDVHRILVEHRAQAIEVLRSHFSRDR